MARSFNTSRNGRSTNWTEDRQARRAITGKETRKARKNERNDIERSLAGVTYGSFGEIYTDSELDYSPY